jgi:hypothetical protein
VQPYWSARDQAFIVPDGNRQNFYLNPIWGTNSDGSPRFTQRYDLALYGDQLGAGYHDQIAVNNSYEATVVQMNGEQAQFLAGSIRDINLTGEGGTNTIDVYGVPSGVTLTIGNTTPGNLDLVTLGDGSISDIQGTVNISNGSGQTFMDVDDSQEAIGRTLHVTNQSVDFNGVGAINYTGGYQMPSGTVVGVTLLSIHLGTGLDTLYADSVAPLTTVLAFAPPDDYFTGSAVNSISRINN